MVAAASNIFNRINTICLLEIKLGMYFSNSSSHLGVVFSSDNPCGSSSDHGIFLLIYHIRSVSCCQTTYKYDGLCTRTQGYTSVSVE